MLLRSACWFSSRANHGWTVLRRSWVGRIHSYAPASLMRTGVKRGRILLGSVLLGFHKDGQRQVLHHSPVTLALQQEDQLTASPARFMDTVVKLLDRFLDVLIVLMRTVHMTLMITPLVVTAPLALHLGLFRRGWFALLLITLELCGPVFVKLGQWASTRQDLFSAELCQQLSKLQRSAYIHDWSSTQDQLERAFGTITGDHSLLEVSQRPVGSGCCAQVHAGLVKVNHLSLDTRKRLRERILNLDKSAELPVAIKVLHPGIGRRFDRDLSFLKYVVSFMSRLFPGLHWLSIQEAIDEFGASMKVQVDLMNEVENLLQFHHDFGSRSDIVFPIPIVELCRHNILVETFEEGAPVSGIMHHVDQVPQPVRKAIAKLGIDMVLQMVFRNNFVHGDLHPGNVLFRHGHAQGKPQLQLVILDPGITATLSQKDLSNFKAVFKAVALRDGKQVGQLFLSQSHHQCHDSDSFVQHMDDLVTQTLNGPLSLAQVDVASLLSRVFNLLRAHHVKLDPNFTSVILAIIVIEGLGRSLDPDLDILSKAIPFLVIPNP